MPDTEPDPIASDRPHRATAIIVAAGRGERFGVAAKCLAPLAGRPLLAYSLDAAAAADSIVDIVVVAGAHTLSAVERLVSCAGRPRKPVKIVTGGAERQHSVALGLAATAPGCDLVVIHDAARPLVEAGLFDRCVEGARTSGAAIVATQVVDTVKRVHAGRIVETVPRDDLWAAQTPQAFQRDRLTAAFASSVAQERVFTDEAGLFEALGWEVVVVPGSASNIKITRPGDLAMAEALLATAAGTTTPHGPARTTPDGSIR